MSDCIFCKIAAGEVPTNKAYEDQDFLAIMDINPKSAGHVQVITKKHFRWVWDVPNVGDYFEVVRKIALAQRKAFNTEMILCSVIGNEVPHAHIWIYPGPQTSQGDKKDLTGNAEKIRNNL